jgi:zinc transport system substrate-binding protein
MRGIYPLFILLMLAGSGMLEGAPIRIGVSVLPLESLVKEIGGDQVEVRSLQEEGDSCSVFEPRPSAISWLSGARMFFRVGAGYESVIVGKLESQFPGMAIKDLRSVVQVLSLEDHEGHHHHGHACEACHEGEDSTDPHIWLDPVRLAAMAEYVAVELGKVLPESKLSFQKAAKAFQSEALGIHEDLQNQFRQFEGRGFYIYHPALGYFAQRFGLHQITIAVSSQGPSARELHALIGQAKRDNVKTIFVQPQESTRHAEIVAEAIGADLVTIDPMAMDLLDNLSRIGKALSASFDKE